MAQYTVGEYIREQREKLGISQEELAFGICTPSSMSKIETGAQMPSRKIYEALMQRLGKDESLFSSFSSKKEMEKHRLAALIGRKLADKDLEGLRELHQELIEVSDQQNQLEQQYISYAEALICSFEGAEPTEILQQLIEALHMTQPEFDTENPAKCRLLTFNEINLLNNIAIAYWKSGNRIVALRVMFYLKEYMEQKLIDEKEKGGHYPMVLTNLTKWLLEEERVQDALKMCELGIDACIEYGKLLIFPVLLAHKAGALERLDRKEEAINIYRQVYYVSKAMRNEERAERMKHRLLERYDIEVE